MRRQTKEMNIFKKVAIGVVAGILLPAAAMAEGNLHAGPLEFHPYLNLKEAYTNNVYQTPNAKMRDWFTEAKAGLRLDQPFRDSLLELDYNAVLKRYAKYDAENTTDHNASGLLDLKFGSRVSLALNDNYSKGHEPRGQAATGVIERYDTNAATASITYQLVDVSKVRFDYTKTTWDFKTSTYRNRNEDLVSAYVYLRFLPKTSAFVEVDRNYLDYNKANSAQNSTETSGLAGLIWEQSATSTGTIKAGYVNKDFSDRAVKDYSTWIAFADIKHELTETTGVKIGAHRKLNETTLVGSRYILNTGVDGSVHLKLLTKFTADVNFAINKDKYSDLTTGATVIRKDTTVTNGASLGYMVQDWVSAGVDYTHTDKNSNDDTNDYEENVYGVTLKFQL